MSVHPASIPDTELFDVERDARPVRGRLRPAPDWGSDELFEDRVPRRRFASAEAEREEAPAAPTAEARPALRVVGADGVDRAAGGGASAPSRRATVVELDAPPTWREAPPGADGRRTVTITGRPGERHAPPRRAAAPRAGAGRAHALAARPDRIMGWAFALGLLLILIALLSQMGAAGPAGAATPATPAGADAATPATPREAGAATSASPRCCPRLHEAIELVGKRWTGAIVAVLLAGGRMRFSAIGQAIPLLSDRLLTERLRELEERGVVERRAGPGAPNRVEYGLTPMGRELAPALGALEAWAHRWLSD